MQTFTSEEYICIAIANHYGLDKSNWNKRIEWAKANIDYYGIHQIESVFVSTAKEPMLFRKA